MRRRRLLYLKLIVLLVMLGAFAWMAQHILISDYDEALHLDVARNIHAFGIPIRSMCYGPPIADCSLHSGVAYLYHPPLYLYVLAPITGTLSDGTLLGRFVSAAFGLLTVALVFRLSADVDTPVVSLLAGSLVAISPLFQIYSFNIQAEVMLTALIAAGVLVFIRGWLRGRISYMWLAGTLFALAAWIKFLAVLPVAACVIFWLAPRKLRRSWVELLALIGPMVVAQTIWVGFGLLIDRTVFLQTLQDWFRGPEWPWDPRTAMTLTNWLVIIARDVLSYPVAALYVLSLPWRMRLYRKGSPLLALEIYAVLMLLYALLVSVKEVRHLIPLVPIAAILVSSGVAECLRSVPWLLQAGWRRAALIGLASVGLIEASPATVFLIRQPVALRDWLDAPYSARVFDNDPYLTNVRDAGAFLGRVASPDAVITVVHEGSVTGYYADRSYAFLYVLSYDQVMAVLSKSDWLLVDKELFPNLTAEQIGRVKGYVIEHFEPVARFAATGIPAVVYRRARRS